MIITFLASHRTFKYVIPREQRDRGNLPVQCLFLHSKLMNGTRRLPRRSYAPPRNDKVG